MAYTPIAYIYIYHGGDVELDAIHQRHRQKQIPYHVGIIMDGNGRWAKARKLRRIDGHRTGALRAQDVVKWAKELGVRQLSLYAFSTENWNRPRAEVVGLMSLLAVLLPRKIAEMQQEGVRFRVLGDTGAMPLRVRRAIEKAAAATAKNTTIDLILCLNYGGQQEILAGMRRAWAWSKTQGDAEQALAGLTVEQFRSFVRLEGIAPVDLLIRTGGEQRISNFHLWDAAYAELYFTEVYWPDYSKDCLKEALDHYKLRERRFGLTSAQVKKMTVAEAEALLQLDTTKESAI